ncbi:MAG: hypothetical protein E6G21_03075 [Actinobacteria bacterium]|nr:MAG: hypothetical protein E6G21_03075 [Actinomycetota bacterium]
MRFAVPVVICMVAAGCNGGGGDRLASALPPGSVSLPGLPKQGLVVPRGSGVELLGLDGSVVARLPRFEIGGGDTRRDALMHDLDSAGQLEQPRLVTPDDRYYRLDASRHALIPIWQPRVPLPGGAELVGGGDPHEFRGLSVVRRGHVLVRRDFFLAVVAGTLVQSRGRLLDLRTGRSWRLLPRCTGVGARGATAYVFCATGPPVRFCCGVDPYPNMWLERLARGQGATKVAQFSRDGPFPRVTGALSPNGRFVADQGEEICAGGYLRVGPTDGSRGDRPASGDGATGSLPYSTFLGWSADGRVVAQITWARDCEHTVRGGVYLVDPRTLKRTYVTRWAWTMWNAFPDPPVALRCPVGERLNGYRAVANGSRSCPRY